MATTRQALARLYRPRRFAEIAMQDHVSATLRAAVARGRVAHAYLFCGPRGVGKTTAARILAMALNCPRRSPDGEPCGECESCERIWSGRTSLDVVEIDAATNRGVDDARDLRERAMYAPTGEERFKVYIIDEAHMLTREAWNALLKILEEPPPRVIFVFATTEPQRIQQAAPPILSRCQRFDFRRISASAITERLSAVLADEGVEAEPEALLLVARRAEGGLRDALSLLDQVLAFSGGAVGAEDVRRVLGLVGSEMYLELLRIVADRRPGDVFPFVQRLLDEGYDLSEFQQGLADVLRSLLVIAFDGVDATELPQHLRAPFEETARRFGPGDLLRMLAQVAELDAEGRFRKSSNPRVQLESLLLRFAYLDRAVEIEELLESLASGAERPIPPPRRPSSTVGGGAESAAVASGGPAGHSRSTVEPLRDAPPEVRSPPPETSTEAGSLRTTLKPVLQGGRGLPPGVGIFLKAAEVSEDAGGIVLRLPPGPGLEKLREPAVGRAVRSAFGEALGRDVPVRVEALGGRAEAPERLTPERVKNDQLARLIREEPLLGRAVEEWDLELLD